MFKVTNDQNDADGTSLVGHVKTTYGQLVKLFGEPVESDGYKVSGEWILKNDNGDVITIYDWKSTTLYDHDCPTVDEFRTNGEEFVFNVGSNDSNTFDKFETFIKSKCPSVETFKGPYSYFDKEESALTV